MKKQAKEIKKGDKVVIGGESLIVTVVEHSDIGKQGIKKSRIEAQKSNGDKVVIVRPENYPMECS